ncbi:shTK domain protein [Ancylostoma caninum]|uniref:ShTK domain protein n=1 Tax=Ancylostoma caninum TaxID=29170 RepID=A0A368GYM3_ANCCA|nr:shTK domain protein [Ancylostoma caninum]
MVVRAVLLLCSLIVYSATGQTNQTCGEYKYCSQWKKNGFCDNTFYPQDLRMKWCGKECGLC